MTFESRQCTQIHYCKCGHRILVAAPPFWNRWPFVSGFVCPRCRRRPVFDLRNPRELLTEAQIEGTIQYTTGSSKYQDIGHSAPVMEVKGLLPLPHSSKGDPGTADNLV